jgi:tetratricopeptide (TPR) repeat protein
MGKTRIALPGGITHGMVVWFFIGSLFGGLLFINGYLFELPLPQLPQITGLPTHNQAAYDAYLNGVDHGLDGDYDRSIEQYTRALEEDPEFSVAWAALSRTHSAIYFNGTDPTEDRLILARGAVDRAFQIDTDLPEAHVALGYYYYQGTRDYERALEEFAIAEPYFPYDADLLRTRAVMYRSMGDWNAALYELGRAAEIEPENMESLEQQALTHIVLRNYSVAETLLDQVLEIVPENEDAQIHRAMISLYRDGNANALRTESEGAIGSGRPWMAWLAAFINRDYRGARLALDETARDTLVWHGGYMPKSLAYGLTQHWAGNTDVAQLHFESARQILERDLQTDPDNPDLQTALGETLAYLGAHDSAIRIANRVIDVLPVSEDAFIGPRYLLGATQILVTAGDRRTAINWFEAYLSSPGRFSVEGVLSDPRFDSIRDDLSVQTLVDRYGR